MVEFKEKNPSLSIESLLEIPQIENKLKALDRKMPYHNYSKEPVRHTKRVIEAVARLAKSEGLNSSQINELEISALLHDIDYPAGGQGHEKRAALIATNVLSSLGIEKNVIDRISENIKATEGQMINGKFVTNPKTITQKIMCDADLSYVAESYEVFTEIIEKLKEEFGITDKKSWLNSQPSFLKNIKWHTNSARNMYEKGRLLNIEFLQNTIKTLV